MNSSSAIAPFILNRQLELLYRNVRAGQLVSIINATLLVWIAWVKIAPLVLCFWWISVLIVAGIRIALAERYRHTSVEKRLENVVHWKQRALLSALCSGLVWAAGALILMHSGDRIIDLFTAFIMSGMIAGAVSVLSAVRWTFRCYAWPISLAVTYSALGTDPLQIAFAIMSLLFLLIATRSADYLDSTLYESLRLEYEQDNLIEHLKQAREEAEQSNRAKTAFLANISHELRTPMNGIIGMADLLAMEELSESQRELLVPLRESADDLLRMMNNLIELSALEAGQVHLRPSPFALSGLLDNLLADAIENTGQKGLAFRLENDPDLPEVVIGDLQHLRKILNHIIDNAIKFTSQGSITVSLQLASRTEHQVTLAFCVADTGVGIAANKLPELMNNLLMQADGSSVRRYGGIGVGLPLARGLIELMGGKLEIESEPGQGSRFRFFLPFAIQAPMTAENGEIDVSVARE